MSDPSIIIQQSHLLGTCHSDHAWFQSQALFPTLSGKDVIWDELQVYMDKFISVLVNF